MHHHRVLDCRSLLHRGGLDWSTPRRSSTRALRSRAFAIKTVHDRYHLRRWLPWLCARHGRAGEASFHPLITNEGVPKDPVFQPQVVYGLDLRPHLLRAVRKVLVHPGSAERLQPGDDACGPGTGLRQALVADHTHPHGRVHRLIRHAVGARYPAKVRGEVVRRVHHGEDVVHRARDGFPLLPNPDILGFVHGQAEYVRRNGGTQRVDSPLGLGKEAPNRVRTASFRLGVDLGRKTLVRLREADVVELDLLETGAGGLFGDLEIVFPHGRLPGAHPGVARLVLPNASVRPFDRPLGLGLGQDRVLEDDDARDGVNSVRVQRVRQRPEIPDGDLSGTGELLSQRNLRPVMNPLLRFHVHHEGVDLRTRRQFKQLWESRGRSRRVRRQVNPTDVFRSALPRIWNSRFGRGGVPGGFRALKDLGAGERRRNHPADCGVIAACQQERAEKERKVARSTSHRY